MKENITLEEVAIASEKFSYCSNQELKRLGREEVENRRRKRKWRRGEIVEQLDSLLSDIDIAQKAFAVEKQLQSWMIEFIN